MAKDETFLSRWSRRKREQAVTPVSTETPPVELEAPPDLAEVGEDQAAAEDEIGQEDLDRLPRIEDIVAETDIRQFLRRGVPRALRNAALRRKWLATPAIRDHKDCAVDYAWDWNTPGGVPGDGFISRESVTRLVGAMTSKPAPAGNSQALPERSEAAGPEKLIEDAANNAEEAPAMMPESTRQTAIADEPTEARETAEIPQEGSSDDRPPPRRHGRARPV